MLDKVQWQNREMISMAVKALPTLVPIEPKLMKADLVFDWNHDETQREKAKKIEQ